MTTADQRDNPAPIVEFENPETGQRVNSGLTLEKLKKAAQLLRDAEAQEQERAKDVAPDPAEQLLAPKPYDPKAKIRVLVCTPMKEFPSPEDLAQMTQDEKAKYLPPQIGQALHELAKRGGPGWVGPKRDNEEDVALDEFSARKFREQADKYEFEWMAVVGGICRARNTAIGVVLREGFDFVISWDRDLYPEAPLTLAETWLRLLSHKQPVVGALYCKREHGKRPTWACSWIPVCTLDADTERDGLLQVAELAGGGTCIHRKVFTELARNFGGKRSGPADYGIRYRDRDSGETLFGFYQIMVIDGDLLSEDYFLNYLMRCAKIAILADTKLKLRHIEVDSKGVPHMYPEKAFPPIPAEDEDFGKDVEFVDLVMPAKKP